MMKLCDEPCEKCQSSGVHIRWVPPGVPVFPANFLAFKPQAFVDVTSAGDKLNGGDPVMAAQLYDFLRARDDEH